VVALKSNSIKNSFIVFVLIIFSQNVSGQKESNYWYFGQGAGIVFNGSTPTALTDGAMNSLEGCASISSSNGQLLFYSDGTTVWNKNHQVMTNGTGLWGNNDASQSSLIIKQPLSNNLYYIFTIAHQAGYWGGYGGISYSVVDINLQGGNGAIITKNIPLLSPTAEKVTAVNHKNGKDIWIMTQQWGTNNKYAWLLTNSGLNTNPVVSSIGIIQNNPINNNGETQGYMKFSHNGKKVASVISFDGIIELYDFDNNTGQASNLITLNQIDGPYGLEFSPNDSVLYTTTWSSKIFQWDLSFATESEINNSRTLIHQTPFSSTMKITLGLQLGLDARIYVSLDRLDSLSIIKNPNNIGLSCNYIHDFLFLKGRKGIAGLPNFNQSFPATQVTDTNSFDSGIIITPVPFTSQYSIYINRANTKYAIFNIYNDIGQLLFREKVNDITGNYTQVIDLYRFPKAIYIVEVITNETRAAKKILKQL
jgi:hypothetical protein